MRLLLFFAPPVLAAAQSTYRLQSCVSGPSGFVQGDRFVIENPRSRFRAPADAALVVGCEWEAPTGRNVLSGMWKNPAGAIVAISDIRMETPTRRLAAYWQFQLMPTMDAGRWTLEIRVNGEPAGSHAFDVGVDQPRVPMIRPGAPDERPSPPLRQPTVDELFRTWSPALVWVRRQDASGRPADTCSGFALEANRIVTAFQCIDAASRIEVTFANGTQRPVTQLAGASRAQDWAILVVDTGAMPLFRKAAQPPPIGERLLVFNVEPGNVRTIGGVDYNGRNAVERLGDRMTLNPYPSREAVGGPLLNLFGEVTGVVGGTLAPGSRPMGELLRQLPVGLWNLTNAVGGTPIDAVQAAEPKPLDAFRQHFTAPLEPHPNLIHAAVIRRFNEKDPLGPADESSEFASGEPVKIYMQWRQVVKEKGTGTLQVDLYDVTNQRRGGPPPSPVRMRPDLPVASVITFDVSSLTAGIYRADLTYRDRVIWRGYFRLNRP